MFLAVQDEDTKRWDEPSEIAHPFLHLDEQPIWRSSSVGVMYFVPLSIQVRAFLVSTSARTHWGLEASVHVKRGL